MFTVSPTAVPHPTADSVSVMALNEAGKVRVTWSKPTLGSGQVITGYSVQYRRSGTTFYTTRSVSGSSTTSYTITNLNLGIDYIVRVGSNGPLEPRDCCRKNGKWVTTFNSECTICRGACICIVATFNIAKTLLIWELGLCVHF